MDKLEKKLFKNNFSKIAGVDEAGRGPLAGPVVAAAVILPQSLPLDMGIDDSKKLSEKTRYKLYKTIRKIAISYSVGIVDAKTIDKINILQASLLAMKIAVENLKIEPDFLLIDGKFEIKSKIKQAAVIKGDSKSISIAAASILAKVTRDVLMEEFDQIYPNYNFKQHKGYPTKSHKEKIEKFGICKIHRKTFKGCIPY